jgi:hypothetical protein
MFFTMQSNSAITSFEPVLFVVLGWLLGILSPQIAERIRRKYRIKEVTKALVTELGELQYTLALSCWVYSVRTGSVTEDLLDWLGVIVENYKGPMASPATAESLRAIRSAPIHMHAELHRRMVSEGTESNRGLSLKTESLPLLMAHMSELPLFPLNFQAAILRIKGQLEKYNQHVAYLQSQYDKTFAVSDEENRKALRSNLQDGYRQLTEQAKQICRLIAML